MKIAIVVVSYNTRYLLRRCLTSIKRFVRQSRIPHAAVSTVVVDNASPDGSAIMVASEFPDIELIASQENLGFTRANNLALNRLGFRIISAASPTVIQPSDAQQPDYVLLLNPDAELVDDALGEMVRFMESRQSAAACGPRLQFADGSFQHSAFQFPSVKQIALDLLPIDAWPGAGSVYNSRLNGRYPRRLWDGDSPYRVDFVLGAALMLRGAAIQRIGGLDEGFFMYCEEMDWCLRAKVSGMPTFALPDALVTHHEAQSSRQTPWPSFRKLWRSRIRFYQKHRAAFYPGHIHAVRATISAALRIRSAQTRRRFARGRLTGQEAAEELAAYAYVSRL